jgi:D-lactate dehydrogenase
VLTSHQGFLTEEALTKIAQTTLFNMSQFERKEALTNEVVLV